MFPCVNDKQSIIFDEFQACNAVDNIELKAGGDGIDTQDTVFIVRSVGLGARVVRY